MLVYYGHFGQNQRIEDRLRTGQNMLNARTVCRATLMVLTHASNPRQNQERWQVAIGDLLNNPGSEQGVARSSFPAPRFLAYPPVAGTSRSCPSSHPVDARSSRLGGPRRFISQLGVDLQVWLNMSHAGTTPNAWFHVGCFNT